MLQRIRPPKKARKTPKDVKKLRELLGIVSRGKLMWEATFDAIGDPVMIIDSRYRILRANIETARRAGVPINELVGTTCYVRFARRRAPCPGCPLANTLKTGLSGSTQIGGLIPDEADFRVSSYPLSMGGGEGGPAVVHHYHDNTEERRLQRQLIQSERMAAIGMLAGSVAHEINNPLAGILAFTQLLKGELKSEAGAQNDLGEIEEAARRCKKIVEDLLVFARPHPEGAQEVFFLQEAIEKILPLARLNLRHQNVTIATDYQEGTPPIRGNPGRIQQVFLNLVHNAAHAMGGAGGGEIRIRLGATANGGKVYGEVIDKGCGIAPEELKKVFDPFFTTKEKHHGTGLGLSICYSIIADHGGKIEAASKVGKGSCFRVILPAAEQSRRMAK